MVDVTDKLATLLGKNVGAPFLFVGSGFSRRYIGLETWAELLGLFCADIKEFGYYASHSNGDLPLAAGEMSKDFNDVWWSSSKFSDSRIKYKSSVDTYSSALKHEIAQYLKEKAHNKIGGSAIEEELDLLSRINVDGIITTNWDLFLEEIFPDYKVFVGQEELLFSNPQSIAEIYKIHGCASQPNSLILTRDDYKDFESKNPYLAAKLITLFIEHPVIFIGYSLADKNIQNIITSIVNCLGQEKLDQFGKNLIFLQRQKAGEEKSFQAALMAIGETNLNITVIKTNDFSDVYKAIEKTKRKIPARILRYCKEQMYDLVKSSEPSEKLAVVDIDQIETKDDVEFVVGVGLVELTNRLSKKGYTGISLTDIFEDVLIEGPKLDALELLESVYPNFQKRSAKYIPAFKYIRASGIHDDSALKSSAYASLANVLKRSVGSGTVQYRNHFEKNYAGKSTSDIIAMSTPEKAAIMISYQPDEQVDINALGEFLLNHKEKFSSSFSPSSSHFRKLACMFDRLKYGFKPYVK